MSESRYNKEKIGVLERIEKKNTLETSPFDGFSKLFIRLKEKFIKTALITNNNLTNSNYLLNKFSLDFDIVITREMKMWKPYPDAMKYALTKLNISSENTISIGDSDFDIRASREAGVRKIYIKRNGIQGISVENGILYFDNYNDLYESFLMNFG
jgi:HAD superfamily hydrolase (TIGR01509 family)